jgi:DNA processing protein
MVLHGTSQDSNALFYWLALERVPRVGPLTIARLIQAFGSPEAVLHAGAQEIRRRTGLGEKIAALISTFSIPADSILKHVKILEEMSARVITRWDADYPQNLLEIYDPPALLFVRGDFVPEDRVAVGIVGTRNPTRYGVDMAEQITKELVREGITIISGLARGIDTACHKAAYKAGGRSIGVLGCGIDVTYPRENGELMEQMLHQGAVTTEFRPGSEPLPTNFYRRNRIISGLAKGVLVVEAAKNSGSLITAHHALEQNRDVLAVPGNVRNLKSSGPHHLIKQGAALVESGEDVLHALFATTGKPVMQQSGLFQTARVSNDVAPESLTVLEALDPDPVPIDLICESVGLEPGKLSGILLELELQGLVRQHPGKMFSRILK